MRENQDTWPEEVDGASVQFMLMERIHTLAEKIQLRHYKSRKGGKARITLDALHLLSVGLSHLTFHDLSLLYSLHLPTKKTLQISASDTRITDLLYRLSVIDTEKLSSTSVSLNFKNVERYIFMLCSGDFLKRYFYRNGQLEKLPDSGEWDLYI